MQVQIIQLVISMVLFFVLFFGISFILNMILKMTWLMVIVYPIIVLFFVNTTPMYDFLTNFGESFSLLIDSLTSLTLADYLLFTSGFIGVLLAGISIRYLRKVGYTMF